MWDKEVRPRWSRSCRKEGVEDYVRCLAVRFPNVAAQCYRCGTTIKDLQNGSPNTRFPARDLTRARPA